MKQWRIIIAAIILMMGSLYPSVFSQTIAPLINSVAISVSTQRMKPDDRGTDVSNIYTISVDCKDKRNNGTSFNIFYYLDGVYVEKFNGQMLSFSFTRNFKGQLDKSHEIRIDLEDKDQRIVARQVVLIDVKHNKLR